MFTAGNFLNLDSVRNLNERFNEILEKNLYLNLHGNVIEISPEEIQYEHELKKIGNLLKDYFCKIINQNNIKFKKLWLVTTTSQHTEQSKLPYIPHFDKLRYLKAMVYLHDVTESHGPIHLGYTSNPQSIEERRITLP